MEGELATIAVEGSNTTTVIINGMPCEVSALEPNSDKLHVNNDSSCRLFYLPVKECVNGGDLIASELKECSAELLEQPEDETNLQNASVFTLNTNVVQQEISELSVFANDRETSSNVAPKRKGGWPKGKKRKQVEDSKAPKAPTTGYVLFLNERRQLYKETHSDMPFAEVTKLLGNEWSNLPTEVKKKYLDEAEADKKRYREELTLYQQSEEYKSYLQKKKLKNGEKLDGNSSIEDGLCESILDDDEDSNGLHCKVCNQFFNSLHNKNEHLYGKNHLQNVLTRGTKRTTENVWTTSEPHVVISGSLNNVCLDGDQVLSLTDSTDGIGQRLVIPPPINITQAIEEFLGFTLTREAEIRELRTNVDRLRECSESLNKQYSSLQRRKQKLEDDVETLKSIGTSIGTQLENLRMVPTLFGMINF